MLRTRDIVALVLALILTRMAWNDSTESLSASAHLAFYLPRENARVLSAMDVDGDGTNEALAVIKSSKASWVLQILDLKPLHQFSKTYLAPFQPDVLFTSEELNENNAIPIKLITGQVLIKKQKQPKEEQKSAIASDQELNDKTRHFFCGMDWHDAASRCGTACPGGQAGECQGDERCFADTPCDASGKDSEEDTQVLFHLTPGGGLPSVVTLWSNGAMTLHSLTNDKSLEKTLSQSKKQRAADKKLELRRIWHIQLLPNITTPDHIIWEESNVLFLDAYSSQEAAAEHGSVVVSGSYYIEGQEDEGRASFIVAVDALKGNVLWDSLSEEQKNVQEAIPLPVIRGTSSNARRRSRVASLQDRLSTTTDHLPSCLVTLKQHLKEVMPYSYWGPRDASLTALHLDQSKRSKDKGHHQHTVKPHNGKQHGQHTKKKWHHRFHKPKQPTVIYGRPNALVTKSRGGLQLRSLKNGMALCHLSLLEETLYSDLNNDGILDQVQVLMESKKMDPNDKWVWGLVSKLHQDRKDMKEQGKNKKLIKSNPNLCHAMALSGLPAREELFSTSLCGMAHERVGDHPSVTLDSVSPVVVESLSGRRNTRDVIVALNNGMVNRLHGGSGRREWVVAGKHHDNFPTWEEGSNQNALLTRIQSNNVSPALRPVLLAGENSLVVLSVKNGGILASASFPQTSTSRPVLAEVSGDGTMDVMIMSSDAIWGFQVQVRPGSPVFLRIMVGLLGFFLLLAVLRNRFGQRKDKDKRATDE